MLRDFFLGFIKIHILHHAAQEPIFGLALIGELARHGYDLSPGTLYPVLHSLESAGYRAREDRVVHGKVRKYYRITPLSTQALEEVRVKIAEQVTEVLKGEGPSSLADDDLHMHEGHAGHPPGLPAPPTMCGGQVPGREPRMFMCRKLPNIDRPPGRSDCGAVRVRYCMRGGVPRWAYPIDNSRRHRATLGGNSHALLALWTCLAKRVNRLAKEVW